MISTLEDLATVLKICRKQGVSNISLEGISVRFHEQPKKSPQQELADDAEPVSDGPTEEQLLFMSVGEPA